MTTTPNVNNKCVSDVPCLINNGSIMNRNGRAQLLDALLMLCIIDRRHLIVNKKVSNTYICHPETNPSINICSPYCVQNAGLKCAW